MNIKTVDAGSGMVWLAEGWRLFKLNPGMWIALLIIYLVIALVLGFIPIIGALALMLITPALTTGLVYAARELDQGRDIQIEHLFVALTDPQKRTPMLTLGAIYIGVLIALMLVMMLFGGTALIGGALLGGNSGAGAAAAGSVGLMILLGLVVGLAIGMAFVYAGPLVMFQNVPPVDALKTSFSACLKNIVPFIVFAVIAMVLSVLATLPMMLGWLVFGPVLCGAMYASYKAILE